VTGPTQPPNPPPGTGTIGTPGEPVRAIAFSSGGINTVMHLGVTHALLVIQGKAPDAVVGVSAGAVSATAMAEVFQAALGPESFPAGNTGEANELERERQLARSLKLRKTLESYQTAPGEMARAFFPDTLQVDAQKPLRPLELPIHDQAERTGRGEELTAHQGFINLFNHLLALRISLATITRLGRRFLGYMAAAEIRSPLGRMAARGFEIARLWSLIAVNVPRAAWIAPRLLWPIFSAGKPKEEGATAAGIIFKPRWVQPIRIALRHVLLVVLLLLSWTVLSFFFLGLPIVLPHGLEHVLGGLAPIIGGAGAAAEWVHARAGDLIIAGYGILLGLVLAGILMTGAWGQIANFNRSSSVAVLREAMWEGLGLILLLVACIAVIVGTFLGITVWADGWQDDGRSLRIALVWAEALFWIFLGALILVAIAARSSLRGDSYLRRLLARYDLADGLLSTHPVKQFLIKLFDPDYYGGRQMDDVVDRALRDDYSPSRSGSRSKLIRDYESFDPKIAVGLMVANIQTGEMENVPPETKVVDGLLAAISVSPLFPPAAIVDKLYLDAANITSEATGGLLTLLRDRVDPNASVVQMYGVSHLPYSNPSLGPPADRGDKPYLNLLDVTFRALQLQRFRDAALERRMTELYTRIIPEGNAVYQPNGKRYLRVWVAPVEPEAPMELGDRIARCAGETETRRIMMEAVADGCRAALEVMIREVEPAENETEILCRTAVERHLARAGGVVLPLLSEPHGDPYTQPPDLFGTSEADVDSRMGRGPPGLPEVCAHCTLRRQPPPRMATGFIAPDAEPEPPPTSQKLPAPVTLAFKPWKTVAPAWPHEQGPLGPPVYPPGQPVPASDPDAHFVRHETPYEDDTRNSLIAIREQYWAGFTGSSASDKWPLPRAGMGPGNKRPVVSFLFSGGVFRGVYQLGSLNALSEAGLAPDVIAGASVGSITGGMVAQAFSSPYGPERDGRIARLAATYLAMDRLILTDRFADFIRGLTLRAASTRFSLRQADRFFRLYDRAGSNQFGEEARLVMAGLERLFWLSPFELKRLVKSLRLREYSRVYELLRAYAQEWLDRMGVGNQVLGAEPLTLLILEHVLQRLPTERFLTPELVGFDRYLYESGIFFLATTTNLTQGRLEILGEQQLIGKDRATLLEGLLASSAFPGVFRPRWSWEVMPATVERDQYIDGGVMDNLPLDAVGHFLRLASEDDVDIVARRPEHNGQEVPHLLFSASLEIAPEAPSVEQLNRYLAEWPAVLSRAKQLRYNKKLELYAVTQRSIRSIWEAARGRSQPSAITPLDLEVVMVRPRWLCGTFGFHPMLGFRRERQAASIAHGCATALLELARTAQAHPAWAAGWALDPARLPPDPPATFTDPIVPGQAKPGNCWFRPGIECLFSESRLAQTGLPAHTQRELHRIYTLCGKPETHAPNYLEVS
jgi:predicted acylesterase/phospholipase RssA